MRAHGPTVPRGADLVHRRVLSRNQTRVEARRREGCAVVEMECAALAACAGLRGAIWGMILYTADSLANAERYDAHAWGEGVREYALALCLDAVLNV